MYKFVFYLLILAYLASGCSKISPSNDYFVTSTIAERTGYWTEWQQGDCQNPEITEYLSQVLSTELTADSAIQIALLNSPKIQETFEELGIAHADLVEAGLLSNPAFQIEIRYPHSKGLHTNIEYLITSSLLDIFLIPLRTKLASTELQQAKLKVANTILSIAFEVRETYYELLTEELKNGSMRSMVELTSIINDLSTKQQAVGNINTLELQLAQSRFLETQLEWAQSRSEIIALREKLNRLLGLPEDSCLLLSTHLPSTSDGEYYLCDLESMAIQKRMDLQAARVEIIRLCQRLGLKEWWTYTNFRAGIAGERELDGTNVIGPGFAGEIPLFNYGQAARMRLFAQLRQAQHHLADLEIKVLSEVREAHKQLMNYQEILHNYTTKLLPMQKQLSHTSEELYNVMGLGVDKLLENKRQEVMAQRSYAESMKKYLVSTVKLDRALGGYLSKLFVDPCGVEQ